MFSRSQAGAATPRSAQSGKPGLSFLDAGTVFTGDLVTSSQLHVEGRIEGNVRCGQLCQAGTGIIAGDVLAEEARIAGTIEGKVSAGKLVVEASGRVTGDVTYETIIIAAGARIDGRLARREALVPGAAAEGLLIATPTGPVSDGPGEKSLFATSARTGAA